MIEGLRQVLKFRLDRIYSFGRYCYFCDMRFWLEVAYLHSCIRAHAQKEGLIYFRGKN